MTGPRTRDLPGGYMAAEQARCGARVHARLSKPRGFVGFERRDLALVLGIQGVGHTGWRDDRGLVLIKLVRRPVDDLQHGIEGLAVFGMVVRTAAHAQHRHTAGVPVPRVPKVARDVPAST